MIQLDIDTLARDTSGLSFATHKKSAIYQSCMAWIQQQTGHASSALSEQDVESLLSSVIVKNKLRPCAEKHHPM